jgi:signal transduction histidine kinase
MQPRERLEKIRWNIAAKGMSLVAVTLIVELVFVGILAWMLHRSDVQARKLVESRQVVAQVNHLVQLYVDASLYLVAWKGARSAALVRKYDDTISEIPSIHKRLDALTKDDPQATPLIKDLQDAGDKFLLLMDHFRHPDSSSLSMIMDPVSFRQEIRGDYERLMNCSQAICNEEQARQEVNPESDIQFRQRFGIILWIGVLVYVMSALWVAIFFNKSITMRLKVLTENIDLLADRAPLKPLVGGADEISALDESFHSMAEQLKHAEQRKQEYISMISHDLRTPLAAIQGTIAVASRGTYGALTDKGKQRMSAAEQDAERLITMINEMLDYDKLESGNFELDKTVVPFASIVDPALDATRPLAEQKNVPLAAEQPDLLVYCDRERMIRVLINLIGNAIKFSESGQTVRVEATETAKFVIIRVRDNGRGIPAEALTRIFDRFAQVEKQDATRHGGTGLGLAICRAIVEAHGGKIGAESTPGRGTTFWINLPHQL